MYKKKSILIEKLCIFINILISSKPTELYTYYFFKKISLWVDPSQQPAEMTRRHLHRYHTGDLDMKAITTHRHLGISRRSWGCIRSVRHLQYHHRGFTDELTQTGKPSKNESAHRQWESSEIGGRFFSFCYHVKLEMAVEYRLCECVPNSRTAINTMWSWDCLWVFCHPRLLIWKRTLKNYSRAYLSQFEMSSGQLQTYSTYALGNVQQSNLHYLTFKPTLLNLSLQTSLSFKCMLLSISPGMFSLLMEVKKHHCRAPGCWLWRGSVPTFLKPSAAKQCIRCIRYKVQVWNNKHYNWTVTNSTTQRFIHLSETCMTPSLPQTWEEPQVI
jgi:hypothetical protein